MDAEGFDLAWGSTRMPVARDEVKRKILGAGVGVADIESTTAMIYHLPTHSSAIFDLWAFVVVTAAAFRS